MAELASNSHVSSDDRQRRQAAVNIQRHYRGHKERRELRGLGLTTQQRWAEALMDAQYRTTIARDAQPPSAGEGRPGKSRCDSVSRQRWTKAITVAKQAQRDDPDWDTTTDEEEGVEHNDPEEHARRKRSIREKRRRKREERKEYSKAMDMQYFLEMVDLKHRYGSNLRAYHAYWQQQDTTQSFFHWLDQGDGKEADLAVCPREQLEREMVRYLSREERMAYLVKVDSDGRLCWAKNGERIDTTTQYKDSKHGIVPVDTESPIEPPNRRSSSSSSSFTSSSSLSDDADRYIEEPLDASNPPSHSRRVKQKLHISPSTILNRLLRKTVRKNTWIFVADISFRLYVGIKQSGAFQHSSFLHGARVSAAGLIKIKDGKLKGLAPLSGHYRPSASHFRKFIRSLQEAGVDMSGLTVSKSYAVLLGLEFYGNMRHGKKKAKQGAKKATHPLEVEEGDNKEEEGKKMEENSAVRFVQRCGYILSRIICRPADGRRGSKD